MIQDLADAMDQQWRSLYEKRSSKEISGDNGKEIVLGAVSGFKGKCYNCNKFTGHRAADCPKPQNRKSKDINNKSNKQPKCNNCRKTGHIEKVCWNKAENARKHPSWYNPPAAKVEKSVSFPALFCGPCKEDIDEDIDKLLCMGMTERKPSFQQIQNYYKTHVFGLETQGQQDT